MIYGYARVSTKTQLEGNGLEAQKQEILSRYPDIEIIEEQYTGKTTDRPKFDKLIDDLQSGDTLVVSKLDRLARNTVEGIQLVENLFKKEVSVHVLNVGLLENTTMGRFFLTTLLAVAEMERNTIIERTQAGKEIARTKDGYREGRPNKFTDTQLKMAANMKLNGSSYKEIDKELGISKATLYRYMSKNNLLD